MKEKSVFIKASDNWYPNYPNDEVELSFLKLTSGDYRVCVWGADDCGMEKDMSCMTEASNLFHKLKTRATVSIAYVSTLGFIAA